MGKHAKTALEVEITRAAYLSFVRRKQPLEELERKAQKAKRKGYVITHEELDLYLANSLMTISKLYN